MTDVDGRTRGRARATASQPRRGEDGKARMTPERQGSWTVVKRERFLAELAATANVAASVRVVGMSEPGLYRLRRRSPEFRAAWDAALREGYARLETMLLERAMNGIVKPVYHGGKAVGQVTEYSDRLALSLLAQHRAAVVETAAAEAALEMRSNDVEAVRARLIERFAEINIRLGGDG